MFERAIFKNDLTVHFGMSTAKSRMCLDESKYLFSIFLWQYLADPVTNKETTINLRTEGKTTTIFEVPVSTYGHRVTTRDGGTHHCNRTNMDKSPYAGPTCTTVLDNGKKNQ